MDTPLTKMQQEIMREFYSSTPTKVIYNKHERDDLWKSAKNKSEILDLDSIKAKCPALEHRIRISYTLGNNIQSAVFSECVYAQTYANILGLSVFANCCEQPDFIPSKIISLLSSYHLTPRYAYSTEDKCRMLIQAGGCNGIDSALISVSDLNIYTIEFKEPGAKTSEPDLPLYGEDGKLSMTDVWLQDNPQFKAMTDEQTNLNFFEVMGSNVHNFSQYSVELAVRNNYNTIKKYADVVCTEDRHGKLVMIPTNQISEWAEIKGEIRPAGRNHLPTWTPLALRKFLSDKGAKINGNDVILDKSACGVRKQRGGNKISGYKINSLFFVYAYDCTETDGFLKFDIRAVRQLKPTIAGIILFKNLYYGKVKAYYNF